MKIRALWTLQFVLAALFLFAGTMKFIMPASERTPAAFPGVVGLLAACIAIGRRNQRA